MSFLHRYSPGRHISLVLLLLLQLLLTACGSDPANPSNQRVFVIGELNNIPGGNVRAAEGAPITTRQGSLHAALEEMGYVEGKNVTFVSDIMVAAAPPVPTASGPTPMPTNTPAVSATPAAPPPLAANDPTRLSSVAEQMVAQKVDLIIAYGTSAGVAAQKATVGTSIPVVFVGSTDPVELGLVKSLQNTEGNVTGIGGTSEAYGKQLEWLLRIDPTIKRVLVPYSSLRDPVTARAVQAIKDYGAKAGVEVIELELPTAEDVTKATENMPEVDAVMLVPFAPGGFIQASITHKIPLANGFPNIMATGPFMSFNLTEQSIGADAARYVDRIIRGAKPSDLPVQLATNTLAINLQTAEAIGMTVGDDILQQASIIIR
jgi:putative tryptophan/tyrosine transport system substrate-binding protein